MQWKQVIFRAVDHGWWKAGYMENIKLSMKEQRQMSSKSRDEPRIDVREGDHICPMDSASAYASAWAAAAAAVATIWQNH